MNIEEIITERKIDVEKMNERELFYLLKGLVEEVSTLFKVNTTLNIRKNRLIQGNILGEQNTKTIDKIRAEMLHYNKEIAECMNDITKINKEIEKRGLETPEML